MSRFALGLLVFPTTALALSRSLTYEDIYQDIEPIDLADTGGSGDSAGGADGAGSCQRECGSDYQSCVAAADQGASDYCGAAYQDLLAGHIDRSMYELIMETCYGMYDADAAYCTESYGMCQQGCEAE